MARSCGRPGCSEPGVVAYGLAPRLLLAWLAPIGPDADPDTPVLCRRHADRTSVPRDWTLDDRREVAPRLFRPPPAVTPDPTERLAPVVELRPRVEVESPALPLDLPALDDDDPGGPAEAEPRSASSGPAAAEPPPGSAAPADEPTATDPTADVPTAADPGTDDPAAAEPRADDRAAAEPGADEPAGLLAVHSPLLARAFHGRPRP